MGGRGIIQRVPIGVMPKFTRANFNRVLYHFNLTNYYLFNVNCTDFDKIQSTVFCDIKILKVVLENFRFQNCERP